MRNSSVVGAGGGLADAATGPDDKAEYHDFVIPDARKLGVFSTTLLIINRVVGTGIYSAPSAILANTDSVGASLIFWVLGGIMSFAGMLVYLEFGTALPRSGGEKVYLERAYPRPRYLATCIFAVQFVLFAVSTGGSVVFSSYVLLAATGDAQSGTWLNRGIAIVAVSVVCLIHAFAPRPGIWISNALGCFKLILLLLVVCTGFAALAGRTVMPTPDNFSSFNGPDSVVGVAESSAGQAAGYAVALLQILYTYSGWENANYVLSEVRNAPRTLKFAAPLAVSTITVLYVLANIAYFAALSKTDMVNSSEVIAATFFRHCWGSNAFVTKAVPAFLALSALGNVFAQSFAMPRVKQELAKEGILPFSRFFASDWPLNAPTGAIFLHWIFTVAIILGSVTVDTYTFVTDLFIYTGNWIKLLLGIGMLYLTFKQSEGWRHQRTTFKNYPPLTIFWILCLIYVLAAPFIPNNLLTSIPSYVVPVLGTSLLVIGTAYWLIWAKMLPMCGFHIQHEVVQLPDGSERVRYIVSPSYTDNSM